jgi:hypothetical protein
MAGHYSRLAATDTMPKQLRGGTNFGSHQFRQVRIEEGRKERIVARQFKTAHELERMILARVRDEMACPPDLQIRVIRVGGRWDTFAEVIDRDKYPDCLARVVMIGSELRARYDLAEPEEGTKNRGYA